VTTHVGITETLCLCLPWPSTACDMSAATGATFFGEDYELYRDLLSSQCQGVAVLGAYCLMPNPTSRLGRYCDIAEDCPGSLALAARKQAANRYASRKTCQGRRSAPAQKRTLFQVVQWVRRHFLSTCPLQNSQAGSACLEMWRASPALQDSNHRTRASSKRPIALPRGANLHRRFE